jgi:hypothetical protein
LLGLFFDTEDGGVKFLLSMGFRTQKAVFFIVTSIGTSYPTKKEISVSVRNRIYVLQPVANSRYNNFLF